MGKFLKTGKVVLLLHGRYAGKKAVIIQSSDNGTKDRPYGHSLVAGVKETPKKVTKSMGKKRIATRSRVLPFLKVVNHNHVMPTRYNLDLAQEVKGQVSAAEQSKREASKPILKNIFEQRYKAGKNKWFFQKLRF